MLADATNTSTNANTNANTNAITNANANHNTNTNTNTNTSTTKANTNTYLGGFPKGHVGNVLSLLCISWLIKDYLIAIDSFL